MVLVPSRLVEVTFGAFVLSARLVPVERFIGLRRPAPRGLGSVALSAAAHVTCLALALSAASRARDRGDELTVAELRIMRHLLEASAARDPFVADDATSRHATFGNDAARATSSPPATAAALLPGVASPEPAATTSESAGSGEGYVPLTDVGGLLASLKRRLATPLQGGFAHVANTRDGPQDSLRAPYPIISDGRLDTSTVRRVVHASAKGLLACVPGGPRTGHVAVTFTVGSFGQVVAAHDVGGDASPEVRACIVRGFYGLVFPAPERGSATLTYPLALGGGD